MSDAGGRAGGVLTNITEIRRRIDAHNVVVSTAGIAFYGLLALVPTLIALVSIYGLIADPADIQQQVNDIAGSLDSDTQGFITNQLESIIDDAEEGKSGDIGGTIGRWAGLILGITIALFSASGAVQKLISTVSVAYEAEESRPGWKRRAIAYGFTTAALVGVALMIFTIAVVPQILSRVELGTAAESAISILQLPVLGVLYAVAITALFRYGPDRQVRTPWWNPGAIVSTLLFIFFAVAFTIYSANVGLMPASYGLLGSVAALMIFLQLTALAVVIGAEVNGAIEVGDQASADERAAVVAPGRAGPGRAVTDRRTTTGEEAQPLGLGKALVGLAALFAMGRAAGGGD